MCNLDTVKVGAHSRCIHPESRRQPCCRRGGRPAAGWRPWRCSTPLPGREASKQSSAIQKPPLVVNVCEALHRSYRSRWGGSSSTAGCWRWFPADTWNSSGAQNTGPWWGEKKKKVHFVRRNPLLTNQLVTSHIFHRIKLSRSLSLWVLRMGTCTQRSAHPENSCPADPCRNTLRPLEKQCFSIFYRCVKLHESRQRDRGSSTWPELYTSKGGSYTSGCRQLSKLVTVNIWPRSHCLSAAMSNRKFPLISGVKLLTGSMFCVSSL